VTCNHSLNDVVYGALNAVKAVYLADIEDIVAFKLSKPGYIVDDKGWNWTRYTKQIKDI
jgi:hypothetical protein